MRDKIRLTDKLATFDEHWSPRTVAQLNDYDVMVVKVKDEFVWHKHDDTDDFFLVLKGILDIQLRDRTITIGPGEIYIVPKGVEHRPVAREEVHLLLIEPAGTPKYRRCQYGGATQDCIAHPVSLWLRDLCAAAQA
ncbi:mannose-6-phosphate isomerase-like protein (cupin superfamily) [Bradyrhizobium sp. AZCC 1610]